MRLCCTILFFISLALMWSCDTKDALSPDESYFLKYYGNEGNQRGVDFVVNADGTFVLLGNSTAPKPADPSKSTLGQQIYVVKVDTKGKVIWEKTFGGLYEEEAKDIELLPDGNLIVLANTANNNSIDPINRERDVMLIKIGQDGSKIDSVKAGLTVLVDGGNKTDEDAISMSVIKDGIIVAGSSGKVPQPSVHKSTFMHMRFTNELNVYSDINKGWKNTTVFTGDGTVDYSGESKITKIFEVDKDFYCFAYTNSVDKTIGDFDFIFFQISENAVPSGLKFQIGEKGRDEKLLAVSKISNGGYLLTGSSQTARGGDILFVKMNDKINDENDVIYQKKLGENLVTSSYLSAYNSPAQGSNDYYVTTEKRGPNESSDIYFSKWRPKEAKPDELLEQSFGGVGDDFAGPVQELPDGHIAIIGTMTLGGVTEGQRKIVLIKLNSQGRLAP
jgi:hypothetical protein